MDLIPALKPPRGCQLCLKVDSSVNRMAAGGISLFGVGRPRAGFYQSRSCSLACWGRRRSASIRLAGISCIIGVLVPFGLHNG